MAKVPGAAQVSSARGHVAALDALRALAALLVFCHHLTRQGLDFGPLQPLAVGGNNGVTVFFVLSGYLLFEPFVRGGVETRGYLVRRFLRIMPGYVVALIGLTLLTGDRSFADSPATYLLFLQNFNLDLFQQFAGATWSLQLEVTFYLLLPLAAVVIARTLRADVGRPAFVLCVLSIVSLTVGWGALVFIPGPSGLQIASAFPFMLWAFVPGMLLALVVVRRPDALRSLASPPMVIVGALMLIGGFWLGLGYGNLFTAAGSFVAIAVLVARRPSGRALSVVALAGATLSYPFYLWHGDVVVQLMLRGFTGPWLVGVALAVTIAISAASYLIVERPSQRLGRRISRSFGRVARPVRPLAEATGSTAFGPNA